MRAEACRGTRSSLQEALVKTVQKSCWQPRVLGGCNIRRAIRTNAASKLASSSPDMPPLELIRLTERGKRCLESSFAMTSRRFLDSPFFAAPATSGDRSHTCARHGALSTAPSAERGDHLHQRVARQDRWQRLTGAIARARLDGNRRAAPCRREHGGERPATELGADLRSRKGVNCGGGYAAPGIGKAEAQSSRGRTEEGAPIVSKVIIRETNAAELCAALAPQRRATREGGPRSPRRGSGGGGRQARQTLRRQERRWNQSSEWVGGEKAPSVITSSRGGERLQTERTRRMRGGVQCGCWRIARSSAPLWLPQ